MRVLHLCSYYNTSSLYRNMIRNINDRGIMQHVYIPMKKYGHIIPKDHGTVRGMDENQEFVKMHYVKNIKMLENRIYTLKVRRMIKGIHKVAIPIEEVNIVHAHSLFTNGGVAYWIKKNFGKDYIVAVRATDIFILEKLKHLKKKAIEILTKAKKIIFISYSLKLKFEKLLEKEINNELKNKMEIIPNGLDEYWLKNRKENRERLSENINILYIGTLHKRKNVDKLMEIVDFLNKKNLNVTLNIIGGGGNIKKIETFKEKLAFKDKITIDKWSNNKERLLEAYKKADLFVMLSEKETFGIAYLEAMSQGLPIIYTKNDGIDGFWKNGKVGIAIDLKKNYKQEFFEAKEFLENNYSNISCNSSREVLKFSWEKIVDRYLELYLEMVGKYECSKK